ncbi:diguanylate cyclase [Kineobactrum sediminis]|uniref:Diguanylate cyclase n=1 Tax=Kineobactrum sediminis TaxID=1905677 RepID=A0A2N5Y5W5_9GAMM|nr:HD-GYP domain-containing protein [Kineobactrum sediminis]PLW83786.1 diguanylate cyclase [Kineobactrum sediminis]
MDILKIDTSDLELGMYVSGLDRPWLETPFLLQGFRIDTAEDLRTLKEYCRFVFVDSQKSSREQRKLRPRRPRVAKEALFPLRKLKSYTDSSNWTEEFPRAEAAVKQLSSGVEEVFQDAASGAALDVVRVKRSVEPMIDSISRNPDACIWLARLKQQDKYTYQHSLGASIWAVALGRQLGLPRSDLRSLAIGGLLFDVGKLRVDPDLLNTERNLTPDEFREVRNHVVYGEEMIGETGLMNTDVIAMVTHHHERHNGSGYPRGLSGDAIPIFARIAAIVDCYDAITSHRSYARAISPSTAIKMLYDAKDVDFQAELVEEFIQAVGIYPAGTLIELSSGEIAVVVAEYRTRRLRPRVMVLLDANKEPVSNVRLVDLLDETEDATGKPLDIVQSLEPDAYGIDMTSIRL